MATATLNTPAPADETRIRELIDNLHKAHHDKDVAAIAAPYTRDAALYDLDPPLVHHGIDLKEKQAWLDTWDGPIDLESRDFDVTVSGDFAFGHGYVQMSGRPREAAGQRVSFWMRSTVCLHRVVGEWKIVHEHHSVPFYMDGGLRPAFDLKP